MSNFYTSFAKTERIDHLCPTKIGFEDCIWPVNMYVTMDMIARFENAQEPTESLDALVR